MPQSPWVTDWLLIPGPGVGTYPSSSSAPWGNAPYSQDSILGRSGGGTTVVAGRSIATAAFPNALLECVAFGAIPSIPTVSH